MSDTGAPEKGFRYFLSGVGTGSLLGGLQIVLYPWLVVGVLHESAERVGVAQMAAMLPALLFVLLGGALSENRHQGRLLLRLYLLYLIPFGLLLWLALGDHLSYLLVVLFGFSYGAITAFVQPARESLLPKVANEQLDRAVARMGLVQFACQSVGMFAAGWLDSVGLVTLVVVQLVLAVATGLLLRRSLLTETPSVAVATRSRHAISEGLKLAWQTLPLRHLMAAVFATGFLGLGVYLVVLPLLARELYGGGAAFFAWLQLTFTAGVITANVLVIRGVGSHWRAGRFMVISLLIRGGLLALLACHLSAWALFAVIFLWGLFSGWSMVLGRTMVHDLSPKTHASRMVSVYQLSLFGAAPLGAWSCGQLVAWVGLLPAVALFGSLTILAAVWMVWRSTLFRMPGVIRH
ncbi:MFS transporter [Porticoccus sp. W117]|uniref:MFS transporter n=1 Tax=Porticoccus sp. W117 TaxID=3054777 RepID=UPI0025944635|nr:MFS transporter [Porticoccus sp. W117]MDM3870256.1 MFS transporter [Porticoccus sp. W117]